VVDHPGVEGLSSRISGLGHEHGAILASGARATARAVAWSRR
jgi:hypothetical protein